MKNLSLEALVQEIQDDKFYAAHLSGNSGNDNPWYHYNMNGPFDSIEEAVEKNWWKICGYSPNKLGKGSDLKKLIQYSSIGGRTVVTGNIFLKHNPDGGDM